MSEYVGKTFTITKIIDRFETIGYNVGCGKRFIFDERGLELVTDEKQDKKPEHKDCKYIIEKGDLVYVVRCKDCKWFNKAGCAIEIVDDSDRPQEDDYCSFGERK